MNALIRQSYTDCGYSVDDVEEQFLHSGGPGGQNVNKVATAVRLLHKPSGCVVLSREERTQGRNREAAWRRLLQQLNQRRSEKLRLAKQQREKIRRSRRTRPTSVKRKFVESKRRRAQIKSGRTRLKSQPEE